jgi:hypothetical protein
MAYIQDFSSLYSAQEIKTLSLASKPFEKSFRKGKGQNELRYSKLDPKGETRMSEDIEVSKYPS